VAGHRPIIGCDPGLSGALALLREDGSMELRDIPTIEAKPRRMIDLHATAHIFDVWAKEAPSVWLEQVGARPTDGAMQAFCFGGMWWALKAMAAAHYMPLETVAPVRWRRAMGLNAGEGKDFSRARASNLLPRYAHLWPLKGHDGRAEAALIALYGQRQAMQVAA
jgi:crossover junction endodeoxyribonuclease RuvC